MRGFYQMRVLRSDGSERYRTAWMENLILTNGRNNYMKDDVVPCSYCQVGTGNTAPDVSQTALAAYLATHNTNVSETNGNQVASSPYYIYSTKTYQFDIGTATGTLAEVGVGTQSATGNLTSRALILDGGGSPTTITILSTELLQVTYQLRLYQDTAGGSGSVTISGTTYDYNWLPAYMSGNTSSTIYYSALNNGRGYASAVYAGGLGTVNAYPSGSVKSDYSVARSAYSNNSYQRDYVASFLIAQGNITGGAGIKSIDLSTYRGNWQFEFTSANIPKDGTKTLSITMRIAVAAY